MEHATARIVWTGYRELAENLLESIIPDDSDSFEAEIVGPGDVVSLTILVTSSELSELRATIDDILACLSAVEASLEVLGEEL